MSEMTISKEGEGLRISTRKPFKLKRRPGIKTLVLAQEAPEGQLTGAVLAKSTHVAMFHGLARAHYWQWLLDIGEVKSGSEIAQLEGLDPSTVNELLRLTLLDPALVMDKRRTRTCRTHRPKHRSRFDDLCRASCLWRCCHSPRCRADP